MWRKKKMWRTAGGNVVARTFARSQEVERCLAGWALVFSAESKRVGMEAWGRKWNMGVFVTTVGAEADQEQVGDLSQGSAGNLSRRLGGAPLWPPSLRTCSLATLHPDVPRLVLQLEVPGLQHPTHFCSQHLQCQPFSLRSCTCASWATCLLTQQVQAFSPGQDAPTPHPPGTPHAPAPTRESPTGPARADLQFPSAAISSCTFPHQEPLDLEPLLGPLVPKTSQIWKIPRWPDSTPQSQKRYWRHSFSPQVFIRLLLHARVTPERSLSS